MIIPFNQPNSSRLQQLKVYREIRKTRSMAKDLLFWRLICKIFLPKKCLLGNKNNNLYICTKCGKSYGNHWDMVISKGICIFCGETHKLVSRKFLKALNDAEQKNLNKRWFILKNE